MQYVGLEYVLMQYVGKDSNHSTDVVVLLSIYSSQVVWQSGFSQWNFPKFSPIIQTHAGRRIAYIKMHLGVNVCPIPGEFSRLASSVPRTGSGTTATLTNNNVVTENKLIKRNVRYQVV